MQKSHKTLTSATLALTSEIVEILFTVIENIQQPSALPGLVPNQTEAAASVGEPIKLVLGAVVVIIIINFLAFHASLGGYFLADDFAHVDYLQQVFNGHGDLLLKNFYTNWMQTIGTSFYRPVISLTLASDYFFWGANATGFHISNFLYQTASSVFLFLALNTMFPLLNAKTRFATAFVAAALFACHPLHPEVVSWIIARVDSVCTTFLFLGFWLYLLERKRESRKEPAGALKILSLTAFVISLMSKEMAITLPPTIFLYEFVNSYLDNGKKPSFILRCKDALLASKWHFGILALYMGFRTVILGTPFGGYSGSIGEGLKESIWKRWFQEGCLQRLFLPFNDSVTPQRDFLRTLLPALLVAASILTGIRALTNQRKWTPFPLSISPYAPFAAGWLVIALAPTIQVFDITQNLQGGRFVYLATAPVVLFFAALIFGWNKNTDLGETISSGKATNSKTSETSLLTVFSCLVAFVFVYSYIILAEKNNSTWAAASDGVAKLRRSIEDELKLATPGNIAVLNLPQHYKGAHMLYNAAMLSVALQPPLSQTDIKSRAYTFEPINFGDTNLLNTARLKDLLLKRKVTAVYNWDADRQMLMPIETYRARGGDRFSYMPETFAAGQTINLGKGETLESPAMDIEASSCEYIDLDLTIETAGQPTAPNILLLSWAGTMHPSYGAERQIAVAVDTSHQRHSYRFSVGELKNWIGEGKITSLRLDTSLKPTKIIVNSAKLIPSESLIPSLRFSDEYDLPKGTKLRKPDSRGLVALTKDLGPLSYDASKIPNAKSVRFEISKPNSWFEHYSATFHDAKPATKISFAGTFDNVAQTGVVIPLNSLKEPGFYELRAFAVDDKGNVLGYSSYPLDFQFVIDKEKSADK